MEVPFFRFQMNYSSFIEITTLKNKVNLFENIRNNVVNFKKTLNSKFARCCFHPAEEFPVFDPVNIINFFNDTTNSFL